jgi:pimeloyl-ACP methyl ester carboxylesterase
MNVKTAVKPARRIFVAICVATGFLLVARAAPQHAGSTREELVRAGDATSHVTMRDEGPTVVLLPAGGRGVEDFDDLSTRLAQAGYRAVLPQPRGIGRSIGPLEGLTLHDLGADVAAVVNAVGGAPVTIVGHAFGNRVARVVATDHPALVKQVILLAAGGMVPPSPETEEARRRAYDASLPRDEQLAARRRAYFATGNDPAPWGSGWHRATRQAQRAADRATPVQEWWAAGSVPILVLQGAEDAIAPPENARLLAKEYGDRVSVVEIQGAGHAMLAEQPERIASVILAYLRR